MPENTFPGTVISEALSLKKPEDFPDVKWSIAPSDMFSIGEDGKITVEVPIDLEKMDPATKGVIDLTVNEKESLIRILLGNRSKWKPNGVYQSAN